MKRIRIALLVLLIAFALASVALILYDAACSARLRSRFSPKADAYPYAQAVQRNELDLDAVAAYGLRLLLAERELSRGFDKGLDVFNSMVSNAIETADNTRM